MTPRPSPERLEEIRLRQHGNAALHVQELTELLAEIDALKAEAEYFESCFKNAQSNFEKETSRSSGLTKERDGLKWLFDDLAKRVVPGEFDTGDALIQALKERDQLRAALDVAVATIKRAETLASIISDWDGYFPEGIEMEDDVWVRPQELRNEFANAIARIAELRGRTKR